MPTFDTPHPITVTVEIGVGDVRIAASERADTVVEVIPTRTKHGDVMAAEQTRVEYAAGRLLVKAPRSWRSWSPFGDGGSVDVTIAVPAGTQVNGEASVAAFHCAGPLGACRIKSAVGDIEVQTTADAKLRTTAGDISVERATGDVELSTGTGHVRAGRLEGTAVIKNSNGDTGVGEAIGDLRVNAANGDIDVERSRASLMLKTANGSIRLGASGPGGVEAQTAYGAVEVAIGEGTAAWLDLHTGYGHIHNALDAADAPNPEESQVQVRARTGMGDITIRRSRGAAASLDGTGLDAVA